MDSVDIVLAAYNGERYLKEQMDSILNSTYKNWKLLVCDDGSKDGTKEIVKEYERKYPGKIIWKSNEENRGVSSNFLEGARCCSGDYIMFCDQDDVWLPQKIEHTLKKMKKAEEEYGKEMPVTVFTDAKVVNGTLELLETSFHKSSGLNVKKLDFPHMLMENKMMGCTMMINKALRDKMIILPEHVRMHDWWIGLIAAGFGKIVYLPEATMLYRQHGKNTIGSQKFSLGSILEQVLKLRKLKQALDLTREQAADFYQIYEGMLGEEERNAVYNFSILNNKNFIGRRKSLFQYGFWKSGFIRNLGLFLII